MLSLTKKYLSLVKFSHTIFAMPFALIGFTLGIQENSGSHVWKLLLLVVLCMVFARNAAMAFNRLVDKNIDAKNPRTRNREIPVGKISSRSAFFFVGLNSLLFVLATSFINITCFLLSPVALCIILGYSYMKRFTSLSHIVLGIGLALAPVGAYMAVTASFSAVSVLLGLVVLFWVAGFDIVYALQDEEFDNMNNLNSLPAKLGRKRALMLSRIFHVFASILLIYIGKIGSFGVFFWIGVVIFIGLLFAQHRLVKPSDLSKVNLAFFTTNGVASLVLAVFFITDLLYKNHSITV